MKQLILGQNKAYATDSAVSTDLTTVPEGTIALFKLSDGSLVTGAVDGDFSIVLGRPANKQPLVFPEVNFKTLSVVKSEYQAGSTFTAKMTIPTPQLRYDYTIILVKKGVVRNERNKWTYTTRANSLVAADVAADLVKQINGSTETSGISATNSAGVITITASTGGLDYEILGADELMGVAPTNVVNGIPATLDKAYVQDLASRCAAGKGFNLLAEDAREMYPGYPEAVEDTEYVMYTLRFAVPRVASKTRDEVVSQLVHIVVPSEAGAVATLDTIFGVE